MIEITAIQLVGGTQHTHIAYMKWRNTSTNETGESSRQAMVQFVRDHANQAYVQGPTSISYLTVVEATPPYVRTYADDTLTDNLLNLPKY